MSVILVFRYPRSANTSRAACFSAASVPAARSRRLAVSVTSTSSTPTPLTPNPSQVHSESRFSESQFTQGDQHDRTHRRRRPDRTDPGDRPRPPRPRGPDRRQGDRVLRGLARRRPAAAHAGGVRRPRGRRRGDGARASTDRPSMQVHLDGVEVDQRRMREHVDPTPDIPYPNGRMLGQSRSEEILRTKLAEYGVQVELNTAIVGLHPGRDRSRRRTIDRRDRPGDVPGRRGRRPQLRPQARSESPSRVRRTIRSRC